jgi:hypothetical protein
MRALHLWKPSLSNLYTKTQRSDLKTVEACAISKDVFLQGPGLAFDQGTVHTGRTGFRWAICSLTYDMYAVES